MRQLYKFRMHPLTISILASDLSDSCLGRVFPVAKVLEQQHTIQVIGPLLLEDRVFPPFAGRLPYREIHVKTSPHRWARLLWKLPNAFKIFIKGLRMIDGDVVY